jgi:hypothetical protein
VNAGLHKPAKAAGHELKGLINMFNYREKAGKLRFPLLALIDYRGFRLIAISWCVDFSIVLTPQAPSVEVDIRQ